MDRKLVFDLEANGLLEDSSKVYCIFGKEVSKPSIQGFWDNSLISLGPNDQALNKHLILNFFKSYDVIIGHNIISYDIPMIKKFFGINLYDLFPLEKIVDTYIWSKVLNADRKMPAGCPTTITPTPKMRALGYRTKRIGPHGLESWGYRVGMKKPKIESWHEFTPAILERCKEDVFINDRTYSLLMAEAKL